MTKPGKIKKEQLGTQNGVKLQDSAHDPNLQQQQQQQQQQNQFGQLPQYGGMNSQQNFSGYDLLQQLQQQGLQGQHSTQTQLQQLQAAAAVAANNNNNPQLTQQLNQMTQQQLNQFNQHQFNQQINQQMNQHQQMGQQLNQMSQQLNRNQGGQTQPQQIQGQSSQSYQQQLQQQLQQQQHVQQQHAQLQQLQLHQQAQQAQAQAQQAQAQTQAHGQQRSPGAIGQGGLGAGTISFDDNNHLHSRFVENEIIKTFEAKSDLVKYVKTTLNDEEQCRIVINSSKPKAIYFQCEKSGSFRTTVKDSAKRQRVAYTKRNKCGYRLVANLYPPDKEKKGLKRGDSNLDDKLNEFDHNGIGIEGNQREMWILRMIYPKHNHSPDPPTLAKKKRTRNSRILVEKPLPKQQVPMDLSANLYSGQPNPDLPQQGIHSINGHGQIHPQLQLHNLPVHQQQLPQQVHHQVHPHQHSHELQDSDVLAAITNNPAAAAAAAAVLSNPPVDPAIDSEDHGHQLR